MRLRWLLRLVGAFLIVAVVTPVTSAVVALGTLVFVPLPATLPQAEPGLESRISHVLDKDGNEIAIFREFETSITVQPTDIPAVLKQAVISAEDRGFYSHGGIDIRGTLRALWADVRSGQRLQGGSTITQQYARLAYEEIGTERTISRKIREAILAAQLDRAEDKEEILFSYLSRVYLGEGAYGVGAASETYFRKPVNQLTLSESALLAGLIPAPTRYSPRDHPEIAEQKRLLVLRAMFEEGYIDQPTHDAAVAEPLWLMVNGEPPGPATVVWPPIQQSTAYPFFTDYVRLWLSDRLPGCTRDSCPIIDGGGLVIETTLDADAQLAAQEEVSARLDGTDPGLEMALVAVEPPTGFVRAMVGGRDYYGVSQVNTAIRNRQTGSAFKPYVLATAFAQGLTPDKTYSGGEHTVGEHTFHNYGGGQYGTLALRNATWRSINTVYTRLIQDVGVQQTMEMATRVGVSMPAYDPGVYGLAVALGVIEITPLEMASAFGVFGNHGRRAAPTPVLKVTDFHGNVLIDNTMAAEQAEQVIDPVVADNVTDVLRGVLTDGTAAGKDIGRPAAGKTGTADDSANAWFVGYTPTLSTAVWMGFRDCGAGPQCAMRDIAGVRGPITGGSAPATVWQRFMRRALQGVEPTDFTEPAPIETVADAARRDARGGFDPGPRKRAAGTGEGGPYVYSLDPPPAVAPTTTSTSTPTSSTSSSTTSTTDGGGILD
jgi:penicillin-binding protein 1A